MRQREKLCATIPLSDALLAEESKDCALIGPTHGIHPQFLSSRKRGRERDFVAKILFSAAPLLCSLCLS